MKEGLKKFFLPKISKKYLMRVFVVALFFSLLFKFVFLPIKVNGHSMEPTYMDGDFTFCFRLQYIFTEPQKKDIVVIRLAGEKVMLLKRIAALEGDMVGFENGVLIVNGERIDEDYLVYPSDWNLPPRKVEKGNAYVVGDNRSVPIHVHQFGQTSVKRIVGGLLW